MKINNEETKQEFSDSRNTSMEIVHEIYSYRSTQRGRVRVWEDPTQSEFKKIVVAAFEMTDDTELYWGAQTVDRDLEVDRKKSK